MTGEIMFLDKLWPLGRKSALVGLAIWALYVMLCTGVVAAWYIQNYYGFDGDAPHYLAIMSSITRFFTLEQTGAYEADFLEQEFYHWPLNATMSESTHAVLGEHGYFNIHGIGLPALMAIPFMLGGPKGVVIGMILLSSAVIPLLWIISGKYTPALSMRAFSTVLPTFAMPFIPASNQIFPDLTAGIFALVVIAWLFFDRQSQHPFITGLTVLLASYIPWLHNKYMPLTLILLGAIAYKLWREYLASKFSKWSLAYALIPFLSFLALIWYNQYAFGLISGPSGPSSMAVDSQSMTVFWGLLLDQNQGLFLQNLSFWVGIVFVGRFWYDQKLIGTTIILAFLATLAINAMHVNWYGGWSFSGRFEWTSAAIFLPVVAYGLVLLAMASKRWFYFVSVILISSQVYYLFSYSVGKKLLWNRTGRPFEDYSILLNPIHASLPALYDATWAWSHVPNYVGILLLLGVAIGSFILWQPNKNKDLTLATRV